MPSLLPDGINRDDVIAAIADFDAGVPHGFAQSTGYDVLFNGKKYPPKAIIGLAARRVAGRTLTPDDFSGGIGSRCFRILNNLGFEVVAKSGDTAFVLCWNPTRWTWPDFDRIVERSENGEPIDESWSTGNTKSIGEGQRVYLVRQHSDRGLIAAGWTTSTVWMGDHWDGSGRQAPNVDVTFDRILSFRHVLPIEKLIERIPEFPWNHLMASGFKVPAEITPRIESLWQEHLRRLDASVFTTEVNRSSTYAEGAVRIVTVNAYERNRKAREACVAHYGYVCQVCGFDFSAVYGEIGDGFIHVHHLKDLATIGGEYQVDPITDLRPVCPNCHAMLHIQQPAMSIEQLVAIVQARRAPGNSV